MTTYASSAWQARPQRDSATGAPMQDGQKTAHADRQPARQQREGATKPAPRRLPLGKYWDEIEVGDIIADPPSAAVLITQEMVQRFADVTGDHNPIHVDESFARQTVHRRPIAHGMLLASIVLGQYHKCGHTFGTIVALLHTKIEFVGRAYPGDRVRAEVIITGKELNPHPKRGRVSYRARLLNSDTEESLVEIKFQSIVQRRKGAAARKIEAAASEE